MDKLEKKAIKIISNVTKNIIEIFSIYNLKRYLLLSLNILILIYGFKNKGIIYFIMPKGIVR